jgi:hypothetical protein
LHYNIYKEGEKSRNLKWLIKKASDEVALAKKPMPKADTVDLSQVFSMHNP